MENNYLIKLHSGKPNVTIIHTPNEDISNFNCVVHTIIDGYYDIVRFHHSFVMLIDDCGRIKDLPLNCLATSILSESIVGDVVVCKEILTNEGPDLDYLNEDDIKLFAQVFFDYLCI